VRREESQRIEVSVRVRGQANPEVHMGLGKVGLSARSDDANDVSLSDLLIPSHAHCTELKERDRVAVGRPNGDRAAACRHDAGKGDSSAGRRDYRSAERRSDVDSAMLAPGVRIFSEVERS
jgi:hypothetical protein